MCPFHVRGFHRERGRRGRGRGGMDRGRFYLHATADHPHPHPLSYSQVISPIHPFLSLSLSFQSAAFTPAPSFGAAQRAKTGSLSLRMTTSLRASHTDGCGCAACGAPKCHGAGCGCADCARSVESQGEACGCSNCATKAKPCPSGCVCPDCA